MYPGTEELLSIRDGEPVDATVRAAVDADPDLRAEVARLQATRERLQKLPEFEPPPGVREKVFSQLDSRAGVPKQGQRDRVEPDAAGHARIETRGAVTRNAVHRRSRLSPRAGAHWPLRGAVAAAVAVVAVLAVRYAFDTPGPVPSTIVAEGPVSTNGGPGGNLTTAAYTSLAGESARLERLLNEIPYQPRLTNAGTATTISGLQDQIAMVDQQLMYSRVNGLQPVQAEALWQERVDLMNALLHVRYAQAQRFGF